MRTTKFAPMLLGLGLAAVAVQPVMAQSGVEMYKELSKKQSSPDLFKDDGAPLDRGSISNQVDTSPTGTDFTAPLPSKELAPTLEPYRAEGGPLTLLNCGSGSISVKTFNSNDGVMWVPFQTVGIGSQRWSGLRCATSSCKLHIGGLRTGAVSGYQVFVNGQVRATNRAAMDKGCSVYR